MNTIVLPGCLRKVSISLILMLTASVIFFLVNKESIAALISGGSAIFLLIVSIFLIITQNVRDIKFNEQGVLSHRTSIPWSAVKVIQYRRCTGEKIYRHSPDLAVWKQKLGAFQRHKYSCDDFIEVILTDGRAFRGRFDSNGADTARHINQLEKLSKLKVTVIDHPSFQWQNTI